MLIKASVFSLFRPCISWHFITFRIKGDPLLHLEEDDWLALVIELVYNPESYQIYLYLKGVGGTGGLVRHELDVCWQSVVWANHRVHLL